MSSTGRLSADWRPRMPARKVEGRKRRRIWAVGLVLVAAAVFGAVLLELCARRLLPIELRFTRNQRGRLPRSLPDNSFPLRASQARFAFARSAHSRHRCPPSGCAVTGCGPAAHGRRAGASSQREVATQSRCASFGSHGCFNLGEASFYRDGSAAEFFAIHAIRCRAPAVKGWRVCRMHGARGSARPKRTL
jgi:hypothetical protein